MIIILFLSLKFYDGRGNVIFHCPCRHKTWSLNLFRSAEAERLSDIFLKGLPFMAAPLLLSAGGLPVADKPRTDTADQLFSSSMVSIRKEK